MITHCTLGDFTGIICKIGELLNAVIPVLVALGVVYFVYGVVTYVIGDDEQAKQRGRDKIVFGIIGLAVIICVWGLVQIVLRTFIAPGQNNAPTTRDLNSLLPINNQ